MGKEPMILCEKKISDVVFEGPDGNVVLDSKCNVSSRADTMKDHLCIADFAGKVFEVGRAIAESLGLGVSDDGNTHIKFEDWCKDSEIMDAFGATLVSLARQHGNGASWFATLVTMNRPWIVAVCVIAFVMGVPLPSHGTKDKMLEHLCLLVNGMNDLTIEHCGMISALVELLKGYSESAENEQFKTLVASLKDKFAEERKVVAEKFDKVHAEQAELRAALAECKADDAKMLDMSSRLDQLALDKENVKRMINLMIHKFCSQIHEHESEINMMHVKIERISADVSDLKKVTRAHAAWLDSLERRVNKNTEDINQYKEDIQRLRDEFEAVREKYLKNELQKSAEPQGTEISKPLPEAAASSTSEPLPEPAASSASEPLPEPAASSASEPLPEPAASSASEPLPESTSQDGPHGTGKARRALAEKPASRASSEANIDRKGAGEAGSKPAPNASPAAAEEDAVSDSEEASDADSDDEDEVDTEALLHPTQDAVSDSAQHACSTPVPATSAANGGEAPITPAPNAAGLKDVLFAIGIVLLGALAIQVAMYVEPYISWLDSM